MQPSAEIIAIAKALRSDELRKDLLPDDYLNLSDFVLSCADDSAWGIAKALEVMRRALSEDPVAITALMSNRVACNSMLADDPDINVQELPNGTYKVGFIGLINGVLHGVFEERVAMSVNDTGQLVGFCRYVPKAKR